MKIHRFYVSPERMKLAHDFWVHDQALLHQWRNVLRFSAGQQLVLFDGIEHDKLYRIDEISKDEAHLLHVTDFERKVPSHNIYLLWSLLKKDKNDWVLQKCTELGVSHFLPLIADRSEKTGFNHERAQKIVIEAAEQCGRSDIPAVREPMHVATALKQLDGIVPLLVCEQSGTESFSNLENVGLMIGPEGGWSDAEKQLFEDHHVAYLAIHDFTLRAETAAVTAVSAFHAQRL